MILHFFLHFLIMNRFSFTFIFLVTASIMQKQLTALLFVSGLALAFGHAYMQGTLNHGFRSGHIILNTQSPSHERWHWICRHVHRAAIMRRGWYLFLSFDSTA